jgi:hypothetical protein
MSVSYLAVRKRLEKRKSSQQNQQSSQDLLTDPFYRFMRGEKGSPSIQKDSASVYRRPLTAATPNTASISSMTQFVAWARQRKPESNTNTNKTNDMKNNEVPEGKSDNPNGDPDDETSGEDTLETDGGGEALEGTDDPSKE